MAERQESLSRSSKKFSLRGRERLASRRVLEGFGVWPGTESNCRHEDFQSSYGTETMCYDRSSTE